MINRHGGVTIKSSTPIGTAITKGAGLYANEIQNARDAMESAYGSVVSKAKLALAKVDARVLGACDGETVYMNQAYASNKNMTEAMKIAEKAGFHPSIGSKTGAEAVTAHEIGHFLVAQTGTSAREIVKSASKKLGIKVNNVAGGVSGYARTNYDETIAESVADVFCNGSKASKNSKAVVNELKSRLK